MSKKVIIILVSLALLVIAAIVIVVVVVTRNKNKDENSKNYIFPDEDDSENIPKEIEEIISDYYQASSKPGTLEELYYNTYE